MKQLKEDLKNQTFHPVYLLYGEEDYLKRMYRDRLKKAVLGDGDEMNYSYFEGKDIDFPTLREAANTLPFFSDHRIIIIENSRWFKNASELADYLPAMPDTTVMVFVEKEIDKRNKLYKYVNKNGLAVEMTTMTERELKAWVALLLKQSGRKIQESTASYLLEQVDNSMTNIKNELDKLIAYTEGREIITKEDIDAVCSIQVTGRIFQMMDAVASGNQGETLRLYHDLLTLRENPMSILYLLTRHFNVLLQVNMTGQKWPKKQEFLRLPWKSTSHSVVDFPDQKSNPCWIPVLKRNTSLREEILETSLEWSFCSFLLRKFKKHKKLKIIVDNQT